MARVYERAPGGVRMRALRAGRAAYLTSELPPLLLQEAPSDGVGGRAARLDRKV